MTSNTADFDIAFIKAKTRLAITLAIGGILALVIGIAVLFELIGEDMRPPSQAPEPASCKFYFLLGAVGLAFLAISIGWAFLSYKCMFKSAPGQLPDTRRTCEKQESNGAGSISTVRTDESSTDLSA